MERAVERDHSEDLGGSFILVADDEPSILQYIKRVLHLANYKVITITTTSVDEALAIVKRQLPEIELVLTDIVMLGSVDGLELAARLHQLNPDLPVLFITGALSESDPRTARLVEKQLLLRKPFLPKQLVDFVGTQVHRESSSGVAAVNPYRHERGHTLS
jgi:DNA-binding response OmpR family regulator